eukprot:4716464-Pyramimonas_sp.AAC.1
MGDPRARRARPRRHVGCKYFVLRGRGATLQTSQFGNLQASQVIFLTMIQIAFWSSPALPVRRAHAQVEALLAHNALGPPMHIQPAQ